METSGRAPGTPDQPDQRSHVGEPGHLNSHQRDTLAQIFRHPLGHNIEWHSILSLLNAVATVQETHKGHVRRHPRQRERDHSIRNATRTSTQSN